MTRRLPKLGVQVRHVEEEDWSRLRELRLAALHDTPIGFLETLEAARGLDDAAWRARARRGAAGALSAQYVAETSPDAPLVATAGGFVHADWPQQVTVFGVFVRPERRGAGGGLLPALVDAVEAWARDETGAGQLRLEVHEDNSRARTAYRRLGFTETGASAP